MLADLLSAGLGRRRGVASEVLVDGHTVGYVLVVRRALDLWFASVLLVDPSGAEAVAWVVDRSPAVALNGVAVDVAPLLPHLTRLQHANTLAWVVSEYPHALLEASSAGARFADVRDVPALVELYREYEYGYETTTGQLRTTLERLVREQFVVVGEADGRIVAASLATGRTGRFVICDGLTVHPDHRGEAWTWRLGALIQPLANALQLSVLAFLAASNPIVVESVIRDEEWVTARLHPLRRFRGHNRLRRLVTASRSRRHRTPTYFRNPNDPDDRYIPSTRLTDDGKIIR